MLRKQNPKSLANLKPWQPGLSPNPAGRPQGARSKLNELALKLLHADFAIHGEETIRRVREKRPEVYLASVVSLLPKQAEKIASPFVDLSDDELEHLEQLLAALRAKTVNALAQQHNEMPRAQHRNGRSNSQAEEQPPLNGHGNSAERQEQAPSASGDVTLEHAASQQDGTEVGTKSD